MSTADLRRLLGRHARRPLARRTAKLGRRAVRELGRPVTVRALHRSNRRSRDPVLGAAPVLVSLTTHGRRVQTVHLTIEAIARGRVRPRRLVLWLGEADLAAGLTPELRRLQRRGLEIRAADNHGPHTKYFPALRPCLDDGLLLVTADDDILYPASWLSDLLGAARRWPGTVVCHQSHLVTTREGRLRPYREWSENWSTAPGPAVFALGVSGVLYPSVMVEELARRGDAFDRCAPRADDVWLHHVAVDSGVPVRQVRTTPTHFTEVRTPGHAALSATNVHGGGNDSQIAATYSARAVASIVAGGRA